MLRGNLEDVRDRMGRALDRAGRPADSVRLIAVTKRCPAGSVGALASLGQRDLAENYPQELWRKAADPALPAGLRWHLIGHLQSNKARRTWPLVAAIHAVDSFRLLRALDELSRSDPPGPSLMLQLNVSGEASKHGWSESGFGADLEAIGGFQHARIVGLMTMTALGATTEEARRCYARLRSVRDDAERRLGRPLPELSMGMSGDFEAAIAEGSTLVRVGSALFRGLDAA